MGLVDNLFDSYSRRARLYPAFIAILPVIVLIAVYTHWLDFQASNLVWLILAGAGLIALSDFARQRGKAVEKCLLGEWQGFPSITLLRHRDHTIDPQTTSRYHRAAERLIDGLSMPTLADEERDPEAADKAYETVTNFLLPRTRDKQEFRLLFEENVNYGFRRNLLGLKPIGILILLGSASYVTWRSWNQIAAGSIPDQPESIILAGAIAMLLAWIVLIRKRHVRAAAVDYARQLLMAFDVL